MTALNRLSQVNQVVSVGSVDGVATTAGFLSWLGRIVPVVFTQAFQVDKIDISGWEPNRQVLFIDLAVNNQNSAMTADFVKKVRAAGHTIVAIIDEHDAQAWQQVLGETWDSLTVKPVSQKEGEYKSSGALLQFVLGPEVTEHSLELLQAADAADKFDFSTRFGQMINQAVKSRIGDNTRRVHLAEWLAFHSEPDEKIRGWIQEYEQILANHAAVIKQATWVVPEKMIRVNTTGVVIDMSGLTVQLYKIAPVVVMEATAYHKPAGGHVSMVAFMTNRKDLDFVAALTDVEGVELLGGFASKANVTPASEAAATEVIKKLI
ncbi:MAG: hypothetical protein H6773_03990 [Pseudomonadales bacterium]|nr:hypothetical protein [Pseudomonadales bacterium]